MGGYCVVGVTGPEAIMTMILELTRCHTLLWDMQNVMFYTTRSPLHRITLTKELDLVPFVSVWVS
jgi:hypothetical protein